MKKIFLNNHNNDNFKKNFSINQSKTLNKISNNLLNYSKNQQNNKIMNNSNFINNNYFNTITDENNNSYNKLISPISLYASNFPKYMNIYHKAFHTIEDNSIYNNKSISNATHNSTTLSQKFDVDDTLIAMKLNCKLLQQKMTNINNMFSPSININTYKSKNKLSRKFPTCDIIPYNKKKDINGNNILNKDISNDRINIIFDNEYDSNNTIKTNKIFKNIQKNLIKRKIWKNSHKFLNINKKANSMQKLNDNILNNNINNTNVIKNNIIINTSQNKDIIKNKNKNNCINSFITKETETENISDEELSYIADELVNTIKEKKEKKSEKSIKMKMFNEKINKEKINNSKQKANENNNIFNKSTNINNNYIITNIKGNVNYTHPINKSPEKERKENKLILNENKNNQFVVFKNSFSIKSKNPIKKMYSIENIDIARQISINSFEEQKNKNFEKKRY